MKIPHRVHNPVCKVSPEAKIPIDGSKEPPFAAVVGTTPLASVNSTGEYINEPVGA